MALAATINWEIRQDATAAMVNGGGFDSTSLGTDYSQQAAAQINPTDLTTSGAGSTTLTSASAPFAGEMVGNVIHITAGTNFQAGWYQVITFTDASNVVLDRTPTSGGAGTGGTGYLGGALSLNSTLDDDWGEQLVAGNKVWVRYNASAIALGESFALTTAAGTAANVITFEGYTTVHGDLADAVLTASNTPTIACGSSFLFTVPTFTNIKFINFTGSNTSVLTTGTSCKVIGCKAVNSTTTAARTAIATGSQSSIIRCEAISYRGYAIGVTSGTIGFFYNYCHDSDMGIRGTSTTAYQCIGNIVASCVTAAIQFTAATPDLRITHNTLYGSEQSDGIGLSLATGITNVIFLNNIVYGFTTGVSHADANTAGIDDFNCYRQNNSNVNNVLNWQQGPNNTANDPAFTDVTEIEVTDATVSGSVISSATADWTAVVDNRDFAWIESGTAGPTFAKYLITGHTSGTLTVSSAPGNSAVADHRVIVTLGHNFLPTGDI